MGKLRRCTYGMRDAGAIWEATYTDLLLKMGFTQGASSPCCFHHATWGLPLVAHGDDSRRLGTDDALDRYEHAMQEAFDVELRGRRGVDPGDKKEQAAKHNSSYHRRWSAVRS